ncbi:hypothetical protein LAZ67_10000042, partial [Cordylochernes scorpioides]
MGESVVVLNSVWMDIKTEGILGPCVKYIGLSATWNIATRPVTATDNAAIAAVRNVVEADRRVTIDEIMIRMPPGIEIRRSSIGTIMSDVLNFRKVCARWVPRLLLENHKQQRMEAARAFLEMHQRDGDQLFSRIVTGDESWVHLSTPETKRQSMVWKKPEESAPKKAKVTISAGKVMAMENFKWEIFTHPPYSPELAPSDFHLYPALKWHLGGKHFANDDEVQAEENHWLRRQDTAWYNSGIKKLLQRARPEDSRLCFLRRRHEGQVLKEDKKQESSKMETNKIRAVIKYLCKKGMSPKEIYEDMVDTLREDAPSYSTVKKWVVAFKLGRNSTEDEHRPGRPVESVTQENIDKIHDLIMLDRRMTVRQIEETLGIPKTTVDWIMREHLDLRKLSARWVPKPLTPDQKAVKRKLSSDNLALFEANP